MKSLTSLSISVIALLIVAIIVMKARLDDAEFASQRKDTIIAEKSAVIEYHVTENGRLVASKLAAEATAKEALAAYPEIVEKLQRDFDVKIKDVKAFVQTSFQAQGTGETTITNNYYQDSTGNKVRSRLLTFDDPYLHFETTLFDSLTSSMATYIYTDTITMSFHSKRRWLLGKETLYASAMLGNPKAKVLSTTNVLIKEARDKRIFIGPAVMYDPFSQRWSAGITIGYGLLKF